MGKNRKKTDLNKPTSEVKIDQYYVVIGVEANSEKAYQEEKITLSNKTAKHQYLSGPNLDWGHGFFYVVHNDLVYSFFSFGPSAGKKFGENKVIGNASTCQYPISEVVQLYVLKIDETAANSIKIEVDQMYSKSNNEFYDKEKDEWIQHASNDKKYRAITNETCAKEAYTILHKYLGDKVPNAKGYIKIYNISKKAICPYAWNEHLNASSLKHYIYPEYPNIGKAQDMLAAFNFKNGQGESEVRYTYYLRTQDSNEMFTEEMVPPYTMESRTNWYLIEGEKDPLVANGYM